MTYERGRTAPGHPRLIERAADLAVVAMPIPLTVLDVGCGDGSLLTELILRVPHAELYVGVDPLPGQVADELRVAEPRLSLVRGAAEALPFPDASFDLVVAMMSFEYWADQQTGARELARVVSDHGKVVLVQADRPDSRRRKRARSVREITSVLQSAGLRVARVEALRRSALLRPAARVFIASL